MPDVLKNISNPNMVRGLSDEEKLVLAGELRELIISRVSENGGHLSSNLGVVELTIALLSCFDLPSDQIVFDVGHQSYSFKLLTGRKEKFSTLRKKDGISGFPSRNESPYDSFGTGHSSTSISAALGLLRAKKLRGDQGRVVAVIGDGALSGGMAYEALNDTGHYRDNLIVILNDNQMSIDLNVGAISKYLNSLRSSSGYMRVKNRTEIILNHIPLIGKPIYRFLGFIKDSIRHALLKKHPVIFEDLGFRYYGPVDGHDIPLLIKKIELIKQLDEPVILHVCTTKGKGYEFAEQLPSQYHGVAPFDIDLGCDNGCAATFTNEFARIISQIARKNKLVTAISAGMMSSVGLEKFKVEFPNRFYDVGIAEEHAITMAAGMAANGAIPVVAMYSTFLQRAYDQILHDICLQNLHVVFAIDRAGIVGADGPTHQGMYDISMLLSMPNMEILAPRDFIELEKMMRYAIDEAKGPVAVRYPRSGECIIDVKDHISLPEMQHLYRGEDAVIFTVGAMAAEAYSAVQILAGSGIACDLIDVRRLKPLNASFIKKVCKNRKLVACCEDGLKESGLGAQIALLLSESKLTPVFVAIGAGDHPVPAGSRNQVMKMEGMDSVSIAFKIKKAFP
jgi:1-deoxy-D-xylulose-5-phosphate synthase